MWWAKLAFIAPFVIVGIVSILKLRQQGIYK